MRRIAAATSGLALAAGFYLLLIDTVSLSELYVLAGVALLAGLAFELSREQGFAEAQLSPRWLRRAPAVFARIPRQIGLVTIEAARQLRAPQAARGSFRARAFAGGSDSDGGSGEGRRALAELFGSFAPNTVVIGVDRDRELLLVHQLRRDGGREELDPLELG